MSDARQLTMIDRATTIISAHLRKNSVAVADVPDFMRTVYHTLLELEGEPTQAAGKQLEKESLDGPPEPAVPIEQSVDHDHIICLEDGRKLRMLKRYLMSRFGLTPEQYRAKWGLPHDYPMVAPAVTEQRRAAALTTGLGFRPTEQEPPPKRTSRRRVRQ